MSDSDSCYKDSRDQCTREPARPARWAAAAAVANEASRKAARQIKLLAKACGEFDDSTTHATVSNAAIHDR